MTNRPLIKICGITERSIAQFLTHQDIDMIGFIFYSQSPRYISPENAEKIIKKIKRSHLKITGVFVNENIDQVVHLYNFLQLDYIQLHGEETIEYIEQLKECNLIKAVRIQDHFSREDLQPYLLPQVKFLLIDTYKKEQQGGTGETFNWKKHSYLRDMNNIIISGGLNKDNIVAAKNYFNPVGFDINSGVEKTPGIKSKRKIKNIIKLIRQ